MLKGILHNNLMILPFLAFLLASFIGGALNSVFVRFVSLEFGSLTGSFLRFLGATLILLPFWLAKRESVSKNDLIKFLPFAINVSIFSVAIVHTSVIMANILYALVPLWVAFLGYYLLGEKLSKRHIFGLLISLFGMGFLIKESVEKADLSTFGTPFGNILILAGVFFWGFWLVGARALSKKYSLLTTLFFTFLITTILVFLILPFEKTLQVAATSNTTYVGIASLLGVILLSSIGLYFLYQWLVKHTSAFIASLIQYGGIAFAAFSGAVTFHEHLTVGLIIGGSLVIIGVFYATKPS